MAACRAAHSRRYFVPSTGPKYLRGGTRSHKSTTHHGLPSLGQSASVSHGTGISRQSPSPQNRLSKSAQSSSASQVMSTTGMLASPHPADAANARTKARYRITLSLEIVFQGVVGLVKRMSWLVGDNAVGNDGASLRRIGVSLQTARREIRPRTAQAELKTRTGFPKCASLLSCGGQI